MKSQTAKAVKIFSASLLLLFTAVCLYCSGCTQASDSNINPISTTVQSLEKVGVVTLSAWDNGQAFLYSTEGFVGVVQSNTNVLRGVPVNQFQEPVLSLVNQWNDQIGNEQGNKEFGITVISPYSELLAQFVEVGATFRIGVDGNRNITSLRPVP